MIEGLKPYPAIKDSGVPWLGDVPEHWSVQRMKTLLREIDSRSERGTEQLLSVSQYRGVAERRSLDEPDIPDTRAESLVGYKRVARNDLVINIMLAWNGSLGVSRFDGIVSPAYCVYRFREDFSPWYYHELLRTPQYKGRIKVASKGVVESRLRLYSDALGRIEALIPPSTEQDAIVRFLHHANERIHRYVGAKQKLIKLLEEEKRAIIHRAVTRGLDPNVRLKPSGVPWLGDVPEHWNIKRFKFVARVTSGQIDPRKVEHREKVLIAPNHIESGTGRIIGLKTAEAQGADSGKYEVQRGEIIYSKIRPNLMKAAIAPVDCLCSADMYPIAVHDSEMTPAFLLTLLLSRPFTKYAVDCSLRVAMPKVNRDALGDCWLWYPDLQEQDAILQFIRRAIEPSDKAIVEAQREIGLLHEFRTRLIADVVTGKLDVREAAEKLPEIETEAEPLDEISDVLQDEEPADAEAIEAEDVA